MKLYFNIIYNNTKSYFKQYTILLFRNKLRKNEI